MHIQVWSVWFPFLIEYHTDGTKGNRGSNTDKKCTNTHSKGYHSDGTKKSITMYMLGIELLTQK